MVDPQQINLYTYVRNNLSKFVDITGKDLILANANAGDTFRQVSTKGLTKAERQNIRIDRNGKVTLINPKAINLQKASTTYQDLAGVINDKNTTVKVYSVAQGQTVNVNGQSVSYQDAYDNGELTFGKPGDAVREVVITVGGAAPILGNPPGSGNKVSFPEDAIFAHEVFGHASGNDGDASVDAENRYRNNSNPVLPEQSGEDHKHTTTVTATPDLLQTEHNQVNTTIPLIPAKPLPPPPKPLPTPQ
jgi:hypothetical protein